MTAIAGSLESMTLGGRTFPATADADAARKLGGSEAEVLANGDGTSRIVLTAVPSGISGVVLSIDDSRGDQEYLQGLIDAGEFFSATCTYASGVTYQGSLMIVGELAYSNQTGTATVSTMGLGKLTPQ